MSIVAGVDIGSTTSKAVVLVDGEPRGQVVGDSTTNPKKTAEAIFKKALEQAQVDAEDVEYVVGTGYGRTQVPFADTNISEITCHGRGAHHLRPSVRTVIDIGDMSAAGPNLGIANLTLITTRDARDAMPQLRAAQRNIIQERNRIGAYHRRLELSASTSVSVIERMQKAESEMRDADIVQGVTAMTRAQILTQTAAAIAVEADADIERVLTLLG